MKQFLLCSTVFDKKQYCLLGFDKSDVIINDINNIFKRKNEPTIWPVFTKNDIKELMLMEPSLSTMLKDVSVSSTKCKIRYNGWIYEVDEITLSKVIKGYWKVMTNCGPRLLDPSCIEFLGFGATNTESY